MNVFNASYDSVPPTTSLDKSMELRIKICGITKPEQGRAIAEMGVSALGFICARQSPRYVLPEQIRTVVAGLPLKPETEEVRCDRIGVFVNAGVEEISQVVTAGNLNGVQLHGNESPELCRQLRTRLPGIEIIKAVRVQTVEALEQVFQYQDWIDTLLLDAYHPHLYGGTGKPLDWQILQEFCPPVPWLLAGGLTPDNVLDALRQVSPDGIDLSSGLENFPGDKNLEKVRQLFSQVEAGGWSIRP
ncbi:phosphoribosylanthranilate isomerase [Leptothermofonsia sichuanensis]|uniref:phosphoribosylanthranilate isomerase n=1 Tax=Leptothermofonsia sichuanensis TaxID=2917832 RepID=UPI0036F4313F